MKNEILDDIFKDDFRAQLQPNEKVIWEGKPILTSKDKMALGLQWFIIGILVFYTIKNGIDGMTYAFAGFMIFTQIISLLKIRRTRYLLTNQRLLFQLREKRKKKFYDIPLEEIKSLTVEKNGKESGNIFIWVKQPRATKFKTRNLKNNEERTRPSLELIQDAEEVKEYINSAIQKKLE